LKGKKEGRRKWREYRTSGGDGFGEIIFLHNTKSPNLEGLKKCIGG